MSGRLHSQRSRCEEDARGDLPDIEETDRADDSVSPRKGSNRRCDILGQQKRKGMDAERISSMLPRLQRASVAKSLSFESS